MEILKNNILLLKSDNSEEAEDKFQVILSEQGFLVKHLKTLEFVFKSLNELREKLEQPDNYSGIIFTTPRTVTAITSALGVANPTLNSRWQEKMNYVVGETTYKLVLDKLNLNCKGKESGNASNLADVIINDGGEILKPFLLPCGSLKTDILIDKLEKAHITVESITVYETISSRSLDQDFIDFTFNYTKVPEFFVYFSPSGLNNTIKHLENIKTSWDSIKFIAIGPTTEKALQGYNIKVKAVASKPTPSDLLAAILS